MLLLVVAEVFAIVAGQLLGYCYVIVGQLLGHSFVISGQLLCELLCDCWAVATVAGVLLCDCWAVAGALLCDCWGIAM